jgi:cbb3-type cytochrome oxidase subunit 3
MIDTAFAWVTLAMILLFLVNEARIWLEIRK